MPRLSRSGTIAIVTGASRGIGAAVALNLAEAHMKLVVTARDGDALARVASQIAVVVALAGDMTLCLRFILEQPDHVLIPRVMILPAEQAL